MSGRGMKENAIQAQILNVLRRLPFVRVDRYQTGSLPNPEGQQVSFGATGAPDIQVHVSPLARLLGLECKRKGEKQTPAQLVWAADIQSKGGFAYRVDELDPACVHVMDVYAMNLQLLRKAGEITEDEYVEKLSTAEAQMIEAKAKAAEAQAKKKKRQDHMPVRRKLPPGTNSNAGI